MNWKNLIEVGLWALFGLSALATLVFGYCAALNLGHVFQNLVGMQFSVSIFIAVMAAFVDTSHE